eukprot:XP_763134.1 hypothetical protein [Theileria parva strain Muguga]
MLELDKVINDRSYMIFGTSAVQGNGILTGLEWLINDINTNKLIH